MSNIRNLVLGLGLFVCQTAMATNGLPEYYPANLPHTGIINEVKTAGRTLNISANRYSYDTNVKVHTPATRFGSLHALKPGTNIGFVTKKSDGSRGIITEIWVLPEGSVELP